MDIQWGNLAVQVAIVIAVVDFIKNATKDKLGYYAILVAVGVGFLVTLLGILPGVVDWLFVAKNTITIGLASAGIYKAIGKIGSNEQ